MVETNFTIMDEEHYVETMEKAVLPFLKKIVNIGSFKIADGREIHYEEYIHSNEKAAIVISHGFCEFTKKYEEVIYYFYQAGYSVYIMDHLGHGYSSRVVRDKSKVHITSYNEYVSSFHTFIQKVVLKEDIDRKLVLFAHSMGGAISALYLEEHPTVFNCSILSSPMLELNYGKNPAILVWLLMTYKKIRHAEEEYAPGSTAFDGIPIFKQSSCLSESRYQFQFNYRLHDKYYQTYSASCSWVSASIKAIKTLQKNANNITSPILLFQAGKDTTVKPDGQYKFAKKSKNTELVIMQNSKHEIYNALLDTRVKYYERIFVFLDTQLHLS